MPSRSMVIRYTMAVVFITAGVMHCVAPKFFIPIVPPGFGDPVFDVFVSGCFEIAGGVGLLLPATRRYARYGLIALLLAVWPANWYMALSAKEFTHVAPAWMLWARLPLQFVLIGLVWRA